jgi:hypothetical protein
VICIRAPITRAMTLAEALRQYREFMARPETAYAFGSGCAMDGAHPELARIRAEADRLLAQVKVLRAAAGEPLNPPGRVVRYPFARN